MVYTDKVHLVANTLEELHLFAKTIGLNKCWFEGVRKKHPHYDLTTQTKVLNAINAGAIVVSSKEIVSMFQNNILEN